MGLRTKLKSTPPRTVNSWLLFVTIAFIAIVFFLYWFVYVKNNEEKIVSKRFEVLAKMGENISKREKGLKNMAETALHKTLDAVPNPQEVPQEFLEKYREHIKDAKFLAIKRKKEGSGENGGGKDDVFKLLDLPYLGESEKNYIVFAEKKVFFSPLERPDVFDHFIVLQVNGENADVFYNTFEENLEVPDFTKLRQGESPIEAGSRKIIELSGKQYHLFLQALDMEDNKIWYVGGTVEEETFNSLARKLDSRIVLYLLIGFLIFIFSIPMIKLLVMRAFDQLDISDVVLATLSVTLCTLLLILLNLALFQDQYFDRSNNDRRLDTLANNIEKNLHSELNHIYLKLEEFDKAFSTLEAMRSGDIIYGILDKAKLENISAPRPSDYIDPETAIEEEDARLDSIAKVLRNCSWAYNLYKLIFWMDAGGEQIIQFSTRQYPGGMSNLSHRDYFKKAGAWGLSKPDPSRRFMMESITSITSGEKLAAVSINNNASFTNLYGGQSHARVLALTTALSSVIDTVVPQSYGFCIIDSGGKVWFHSDRERNLQENFIYETANHPGLKDAVFHRKETYLSLTYHGRKHRVRITPLAHFPLFLVTMHEKAYTQTLQTRVIIDTVVIMLALYVFNCFILLFAAGVNYRKSLLNHRYVPFDWLRPQVTKESSGAYIHLMVSNLFILGLLIGFIYITGTKCSFFLCLSAHYFAFIYNYVVINKVSMEDLRSRKVPLTLFLPGSLLLIHLASGFTQGIGQTGRLFFFQGLLAAMVAVMYLLNVYKANQVKKAGQKSFSNRPYFRFIFSWVLLTNVVPIIIFFNHNYSIHRQSADVVSQLALKYAIEERSERLDTFYKDRLGLENHYTRAEKKAGGIYKFDSGKSPSAGISSYSFFKKMEALPAILFLGALLTIFGLSYFMIRFVCLNVFGLHTMGKELKIQTFPAAEEEVLQFLRAGAHVALMCYPPRQKNVFQDKEDEILDGWVFQELTFPNIKPSGESDILIIDGVDAVLTANESRENLTETLNRIEELLTLLQARQHQVILPLTTPLTDIVDMYSDIARGRRERKKDESKNEQAILAKAVAYRLRDLEKNLAILHTSLEPAPEQAFNDFANISPPELHDFIIAELLSLEYFIDIKEDLANYCQSLDLFTGDKPNTFSPDELEEIKERIILKIQELASNYYLMLFNGCSRKEKFVLYDIALDRLININNKDTITLLLKKGLLKNTGTIEVVNRSFRNYILCSVDSEEAKEIIGTLVTKGRWKSYRAPLYLLILGAAVFLAFQKDLMNDIQSFSTAIIGGLAILTKFTGALNKLPFTSND